MMAKLTRLLLLSILVTAAAGQTWAADPPGLTVLGTGFTGRPFVLEGDLVVESDTTCELVRDYATPVPALVGWFDHRDTAWWKQVALDDGLLVALYEPYNTSVNGFGVVDASDPGALTLEGSLMGMEFDSLWLRDGAATFSSGTLLVTYDLATPSSPTFSAASIAGDNEGLRWFSEVDGTLYLVDHGAVLGALSVADPRHPTPLAPVSMAGDRIDAMVADNGHLHALVVTGDQLDLVTWSVAVAGVPVEVDRQGLLNEPGARGLYLVRNGDLLLASGSDGVVRAFGLASPAAPAAGWTLAHDGDHLAISASKVFVSEGDDLFIYERTAFNAVPGAPARRGALPPLFTIEGQGHHLIGQLDDLTRHLVPIDVSDPACPFVGAPIDLGLRWDLQYAGGIGAMLENSTTCRLIDLRDAQNPALMGAVTLTDSATIWWYDLLSPELLLVESENGVVTERLYDISDPWNPGPGHEMNIGRFRFADARIAITGDVGELQIYDITDLDAPVLLGALDIDDLVSGMVLVREGHAYVSTYTDAGARNLRVFDVTDPSAPVLTANLQLAVTTMRKDFHGNRLYLQRRRGFDVYDLTAPGQPALIGSVETPYTHRAGFAMDGNVSIVSPRLVTVRNDGLSPSGVDRALTPTLVTLLPAFPNPCNPATRIAFNVDRARDLSVTVHDVRGRRVAELANGTFSAGPHELTWSGVDGAGAPVASGVYLVRLHGKGVEAFQPVTLLK